MQSPVWGRIPSPLLSLLSLFSPPSPLSHLLLLLLSLSPSYRSLLLSTPYSSHSSTHSAASYQHAQSEHTAAAPPGSRRQLLTGEGTGKRALRETRREEINAQHHAAQDQHHPYERLTCSRDHMQHNYPAPAPPPPPSQPPPPPPTHTTTGRHPTHGLSHHQQLQKRDHGHFHKHHHTHRKPTTHRDAVAVGSSR